MPVDEQRSLRWSLASLGLTFEAATRLLYARVRLPALDFVKLQPAQTYVSVTGEQIASAKTLARAVVAASNRSPVKLTCVHKSLALWWMLRARGIAGVLRVGVAQGSEAFAAHAWVECGHVALGEPPDVLEHYAPFAEAVVPLSRTGLRQ